MILNKLDLVTSDEAIEVKVPLNSWLLVETGLEDRIRAINKYAKIIPAVKGRVKVSELCNMRAHAACR